MALTPAQKQQRYRDRKRAASRGPGDASAPVLQKPFSEFYAARHGTDDFEIPLHLAGVEPPSFDNDGPAVFSSMLDGSEVPPVPNSIARAELAVECLIDAGRALAEIVNAYKQSEIKARIAEIEQSDLSDPETRRKALADVVRFQKMLDQLSKQVRWAFPQWKVTGE